MEVGVYEAKAQFSKLLECVEAGEEITVTRHGRAVARLPPVAKRSRAEVDRLVAKFVALNDRIIANTGGATIDEIIAWKDEGRR